MTLCHLRYESIYGKMQVGLGGTEASLKHIQSMSVLQSLNTINASSSLISFQCCTRLNHHLTEFQLTEEKGGRGEGWSLFRVDDEIDLSHGE